MAGESAREIAQRRREKAERLHRVADAYEKGADGEDRTAAALAALPDDWFVLHDVRWPGRPFANVDHVVVGFGGVFVIDSKAWSGRVEVRDGVLRQNGRSREPAVAAAAEAALAVARALGMDPHLVKPVLCFVGSPPLAGWARDVMLATPDNVVAMLTTRPRVLDAHGVQQCALGLQVALDSARRLPGAEARPAPVAGTTRRVLAPSMRPRSRPATSRRRGKNPLASLLRFLIAVGLVLIGLPVLLSHADDIGQRIAGLAGPTPAASEHRLGQDVRLPPALHRPTLTITAGLAGQVHRVGTLPYLFDGNRFFAVRLTIHNSGHRPWVSQPGTTYQVTDALGVRHTGGTAMRIREGRMLPDPIRIPAGRTVRGYVVFQVPAGQPLASVSVTVGPGAPGSAAWSLGRQ